MKVVFSRSAGADLEAIGDHIARDSPARAVSFLLELEKNAQQIGNNPKAYPLVPRYEDRGIRRRVHGEYLIFFRIEADKVTILHVLHGARDYASLLFPDD